MLSPSHHRHSGAAGAVQHKQQLWGLKTLFLALLNNSSSGLEDTTVNPAGSQHCQPFSTRPAARSQDEAESLGIPSHCLSDL